MQLPDKMVEYLETVRQQIRWKKAQAPVLEEIRNHLSDQKDALIKDGIDEETAICKAIEEMSDPVVVGEQLDRTHRPRPDWPLLAMTAILLLFGLSIQFMIGLDIHNGMEMFYKQVIWSGLAIIVLLVAYFVDFTIMGKYSWIIYLLLIAMTIGGSWFYGRGYARLTAIPLLLFPTIFAGMVYRIRNRGYGGLILCGATAIIPALLSLFTHNWTVLALICLSCLTILTYALAKGWFNVRKLYSLLILYLSSAIVLSMMFFTLISQPYARQRLQVVFNPSLEPTSSGYIGTVIQRFLSNSRLIGEGLPVNGYGQYPLSHLLPGANSDFILTYLTYKFGWIIFIGIILIFMAFITRSVLMGTRQRSLLGQLVSLAIILTFAIQWFTFIVSNSGFLLFGPLTLH
ncbi:lipid II flippase FtsW [Peptococcaceae bacterium CEB3]|nr:lipid II flippase FtsW [Peptococcaceae bacterium CEB3]